MSAPAILSAPLVYVGGGEFRGMVVGIQMHKGYDRLMGTMENIVAHAATVLGPGDYKQGDPEKGQWPMYINVKSRSAMAGDA